MGGLFDDLVPSGGPPDALRITVRPPGVADPIDPKSRELAIRTVLGEAAGEPDEGQAAVAAVIRNRLQSGKFGPDLPNVVLARNQFEPWSTESGRQRMFSYAPDSPDYQRAAANVDLAFNGFDPTNGATHFYSPTAQAALGRQAPSWAQGEPLNIGRHAFYAPGGQSNAQPIGLFSDLVPVTSPQVTSPPAGTTNALSVDSSGGRFSDNTGMNIRTAREGDSPPVATRGEAALGGFANSATFNFRDELKGLLAAGGFDFNKQDSPADLALIKGIYKLATGDPEASAAYRVATSQARETAQLQKEQQPSSYTAGELGGAAATIPLGGAAAPGLTLGARTLQGAKAGAVFGGLSGIGEGTDLQSRAAGGATGAAVGGAVGTVAPTAVEGLVQGARGLAAPLAPVARAVRGAFDPEAEAARRVAGALQRDAQAAGGPAGLTPAEFAADRAAGGPATLMDFGGETTRALARSAANSSPEGRAALNTAINDRFESQSGRVTDWLNRTFGPSDTGATREALQDAARQANKPAYAKAYRDGDQPLWSPELQRLVSSPDVVDAMRAAAEKGKSRAVVDGFGGFNSSVQVSPTGVVEFTRGANGQPTYPNLQFWDYTKRALDDAANAARRAGRNDEASVLGSLSTKLRSELDGLVPSYQNARAGAARFFGAGDALEAGEKFLTGNMPLPDARRAFSAMTPAERDLFREGFVQSLTSKIEATGDRRNVLNAIAQSPRAQQQIELAMGPQKAREFEAMMRVEGIMDLARSAVQGNSTTARQLTELGLAGGVGAGSALLTGDPHAMLTGALVYGAARGRNMIDQRVAQRVAEMLTSNDPSVLRKGINIVGRNQNMLNALRSFDQGVARAGTQQASGIPAIQAAGIGRAENDQPQVQGP